MRFGLRLAFLIGLALGRLVAADSAEFTAAMALYKAQRYPEAREAWEKVTAAEPKNAAAAYYLGMTWRKRGDNEAMEKAIVWLGKASELEPKNATYLADYGGTSLELASRTWSLGAATRGRDAMEKAVAMDPGNVDARDGLFQFYTQAPWPLGSSAKAAAHLAEIQKLDPERGTALAVIAKANAKDFAAAFALCEAVLKKEPDSYLAGYQYGRTASISGQNLDRGLALLQKCLTRPPPYPASPTHSNVWQRIGNIQEKLQHPADARTAYETALKLDPTNKQASDALGKLK